MIDTPPIYRQTQTGWLLIVAVLVPTLVVLWLAFTGYFGLVVAFVPLSVLAVVALFARLTITVTEDRVEAAFGGGVVRRRIPIDQIRLYDSVRNRWWYGWGIHWIPGRGWLYNVSGLSAVELELANGKCVRIGTNEPGAVTNAIRTAIASTTGNVPGVARAEGVLLSRLALLAVSALIPLSVAALLYAELRPPTVHVSNTRLSVASAVYGEEIPLQQIVSVSLEDRLPRVRSRTNGTALAHTLRGHFRLDELGAGQLFVATDAPPFLLVRTSRDYVFLNFEDPDRTREVYADLTRALGHQPHVP